MNMKKIINGVEYDTESVEYLHSLEEVIQQFKASLPKDLKAEVCELGDKYINEDTYWKHEERYLYGLQTLFCIEVCDDDGIPKINVIATDEQMLNGAALERFLSAKEVIGKVINGWEVKRVFWDESRFDKVYVNDDSGRKIDQNLEIVLYREGYGLYGEDCGWVESNNVNEILENSVDWEYLEEFYEYWKERDEAIERAYEMKEEKGRER